MKVEPVYLLLGPDAKKKSAFIDQIVKSLQERGDQVERWRAWPADPPLHEVLSRLLNRQLFTTVQVVTLSSVESLKAAEIALLKEYLKAPSRESTLFLITDKTKVSPALSQIVSSQQTKVFREMFEDRRRNWIIHNFHQKGISINPLAASLLVQLVGVSSIEIESLCESLATFLGQEGEITESEIERLIFHSKIETVFTLFEKMGKKDLEGSLKILENILHGKQADPVALVAGILWQYREILSLKQLLEEGYSPRQALQVKKVLGKKRQESYLAAIENYSQEDLKRIVILSERTDGRLRRLNEEGKALLLKVYLYRCLFPEGRKSEEILTRSNLSRNNTDDCGPIAQLVRASDS